MRVLLTNDDGGPDELASSYIKYFVSAVLKHTDWDLTIAVPFSQKSWIGKAHFAGNDVTVKFIYSTISKPEDNSYQGPFPTPQASLRADPDLKEWCLIDNGTPATCTDIGLNHLCGRENIDLVVSGPNVGRNSSVIYALSSGTIGGAMEGCHQGKKAIALSYAYRKSYITEPSILKEASLISVRTIQNLWDNWGNGVDMYAINVPLDEDIKLGKTQIMKAPMLENSWSKSLYKKHQHVKSVTNNDIIDQSVSIPESLIFKWCPDFDQVHADISTRDERADGTLLESGMVCVTALRANFMHVDYENQGEIILAGEETQSK